MIKTLEKSGRTEDDAINAALKELGLDRDDVSVEVLERAKSGFLGIGASPAVIRVSYEVPDEKPAVAAEPVVVKTEAPKAAPAAETEAPTAEASDDGYGEIRSFLTGLLDRMGVKAELEIAPRENGGINVNISGSNMGAIIGRRGETLDAIQHLTNYVVNRNSDTHLHISVDAENYRSKREESLTKLAEKMAEKAIKYKRSMALEPMNSYERHVIHTALQNYKGVTTSSTGVEPNRRVVVAYVRGEDSRQQRGDRRRPSAPAAARSSPAQPAQTQAQPQSSSTTNQSSNKPQSREWA